MTTKIVAILFIACITLGIIALLLKVAEAQLGSPPPSPPELRWHHFQMPDGTNVHALGDTDYQSLNNYVEHLMRMIKQLNDKYINMSNEENYEIPNTQK